MMWRSLSLLLGAFYLIVVCDGWGIIDIAVSASNVTGNETEFKGASLDPTDAVISYNETGNDTTFIVYPLADNTVAETGEGPPGPSGQRSGPHDGPPRPPEVGCTVRIQSYSATNPVDSPPIGYVDLNGHRVWSAGWGSSSYPNYRGVSTILINPVSCSPTQIRTFDTYGSSQSAAYLAAYLQWLLDGSVVAIVTGDEPTSQLGAALPTLTVAGVFVTEVKYRGNFAAILQRGYPDKTMLAKSVTNAARTSRLNVRIQGSSGPDLQFTRLPDIEH